MGLRHGLEVSFAFRLLYPPNTDIAKLVANTFCSYALQWLVVLPLEIIAASMTVTYWNPMLNKAIFVTIFLMIIISINMFGVKGYGEAEFVFAIIKVTAIVGFMYVSLSSFLFLSFFSRTSLPFPSLSCFHLVF